MAARTRIKVCGMTDVSDVRDAVEAGVDAVGFIFVKKSPRWIEPDAAREIVKTLPPFVDAVGVFVDEEPDVANDIINYCGLTIAQLHGNESPEYCEVISTRVIKSFSVRTDTTSFDFDSYAGIVSGYLLDTYHEKMAGGTGKTFNWSILENINPPGPIILAGGLNPENVGEAISIAAPFAVDVNTGVEIEPGKKAAERIRQVVEEVTKADRQQ